MWLKIVRLPDRPLVHHPHNYDIIFRKLMMSRIWNRQVTLRINDFGIAHFSLFVIAAWKYIFKAIIFIHVALIHKIDVFSKIFIRKNSKMPLILYFLILFFQHCLRNNITDDFWKINVFLYLVPFALNVKMLYIDGKLMKRQKMTYNML